MKSWKTSSCRVESFTKFIKAVSVGILLAEQNISCKVNRNHNANYLACPAGRFPVWTSSLTELRRKMPKERKSREERDLS